MKEFVVLSIAVAFLALSLAGCGGSGEPTQRQVWENARDACATYGADDERCQFLARLHGCYRPSADQNGKFNTHDAECQRLMREYKKEH